MKREEYQEKYDEMQHRLMLLQTSYNTQGQRGVVVLEGWDAAGKGGLIRRLAWATDPRTVRVYPIGAPDSHEQKEHWLQRFWTRVPVAGEIAVFDRSWYGRVLVERVEGFADEAAWKRAYREINEFEQQLLAEDFRIVKLFLDITPETQLKRLQSRLNHPYKRWKLTEDDIRNRHRWPDYEEAYADMIEKTSQRHAKWIRIDANEKRRSRLDALEEIYRELSRGLKLAFPEPPVQAVNYLTRHKAE